MANIEQELRDVVNKLKKIEKSLEKNEIKKILKKSAKPMLLQAKANVPVSTKVHYRYSTAKISSKLGAPKGKGKKVASYSPGNLKRAIQFLNFRKSKYRIHIGPRVTKGNKQGSFSGRRVDGFYAAWVEFGTRKMKGSGYMRRAFESTKGVVKSAIIKGARKRILEEARKQKLN